MTHKAVSYSFGFNGQSLSKIFESIYSNACWNDSQNESVSGSGSSLFQTETLRQQLVDVLKQLKIQSIADLGCGDVHWIKEIWQQIPTVSYTGYDIVPDLIAYNQKKYGRSKDEKHVAIQFVCLDGSIQPIAKHDAVLCRDVFGHLCDRDIWNTVDQLKASGSTYLMATTFTDRQENVAYFQSGNWRTIQLQAKPFSFPKPMLVLNEQCSEGEGSFHDKSLGIWKLADLTTPSMNLSQLIASSVFLLDEDAKEETKPNAKSLAEVKESPKPPLESSVKKPEPIPQVKTVAPLLNQLPWDELIYHLQESD